MTTERVSGLTVLIFFWVMNRTLPRNDNYLTARQRDLDVYHDQGKYDKQDLTEGGESAASTSARQ